jgi:hypothetical protein
VALSQEYSGRDRKLITHLHLVVRTRMVELYLHSLHVFMMCKNECGHRKNILKANRCIKKVFWDDEDA